MCSIQRKKSSFWWRLQNHQFTALNSNVFLSPLSYMCNSNIVNTHEKYDLLTRWQQGDRGYIELTKIRFYHMEKENLK